MGPHEHPWMHWHPHPWDGGYGWGPTPGPGPEPSMFLSALGTVFWIAMLIIMAWVLLRLILPYMRPLLADLLDSPPGGLSSLDKLRERYAAGEIDAETFAQMRERLVASYEPKDIRPAENAHSPVSWNGHKEILSSPVSYEQVGMMEQRQHLSDSE
ncbi:MAG TPA: SHOCT domain-containing protein [Ktedonobacteraceae bacterium]|nr:SHOCT domain-containing protein [Ktedonobacteraceae bacterium]